MCEYLVTFITTIEIILHSPFLPFSQRRKTQDGSYLKNDLTFTQQAKLFPVKHFMSVVHSAFESEETFKKNRLQYTLLVTGTWNRNTEHYTFGSSDLADKN